MNFWNWLFRRHAREKDLDDEVQAHLRMAAQERIAAGESAEQARVSAVREFGNVDLVKETARDIWGFRWLEQLIQDVRYSLRQLGCNPGFTVVAMLTLALGIGATASIFSVIYALALRSLPVPQPDRLVEIGQNSRGNLHTYGEWKLFRDRQDIFLHVFSYNYFDTNFNITGAKERRAVSGLYVSGDYFQGLGVQAVLGRVLQASDDQPGVPPVCVLGYGLWRQLYGESRDILGRALLVNGHEFQIVGVAPRSFFGVDIGHMPEIFMPLEAERTYSDYPLLYGRQTPSLDDPHATILSFIGRLRPGVRVSQANAGLQVLSAQIYGALSGASDANGRAVVRGSLVALPITSDAWLQDMDMVLLLMAMAAVALIICCANLGNLLLARATKRQAEIATRLALGATRWRLIRQLLTESITVSLIGAAAGLLVERWASRSLIWALSWPDDTLSLDLSWDARLVVFALGITLSCALLFGLAPAIRATYVSIYSAMKNGVAAGRRSSRFSNSLLVVLQLSLSMALLVSAGLLVRTLHALLSQDPGYDPRGILVCHPSWQGPSETLPRAAFTGERLLREFRSVPGVTSASWSRVSSEMTGPRLTVSGPTGSEGQSGSYLIFVSSHFFRTRRTPILAGRDFSDGDSRTSFPVAILSEDLAKTLFHGVNPVGLSFRENDRNGKGQEYPVEIVGIAGDIQYRRPGDGALPILYRPVAQCADSGAGVGVYEVRVAGSFPQMTKRLEKAAENVDSHISIRFEPLTDTVSSVVHRNRAMALIATAFGLFVSLLAVIGVYGVTSSATAERTREIGIRLALGAQPADVLWMILGETAALVWTGIAIGVTASFAASRMIRGLIWGVAPTDPLSFGLAVCLMLLISGIAAFLPARRATKVDPMVALRYE
ncbi:MAG TPA: ABC transporter permease [Terriglobia bacterium]|nr:ABC transporter permease [Terriglobia bacterium]